MSTEKPPASPSAEGVLRPNLEERQVSAPTKSNLGPSAGDPVVRAVWQRAERRMVDLLGVGVAHRRVDGLVLQANPAAIAILGLHRDEHGDLRPNPALPCLRDDGSHCPAEEEPFARAIATGENQGPIRVGLRRREDLVTWAMHQVLLVQHPVDGHLLGAVHSVLDITAWRDSSDALRRSQDLLRKAQEIARVGSWDWDLKRGTVVWTEEMHRIFGIPVDAFDGSPTGAIRTVHPDDRVKLESRTRLDMSSFTNSPLEFRVVWPDGEIRDVWAEGETISDDAGAPIRMFGAVQDVTDRRRAERERRSLEEQLRQAQKMDSVGQLAGGVAHDFNNLLQVILGNAELALGVKDDPDRVRDILGEIRRGAERAAELTQQLLVFSRRQVIRPIVLDLNQLLERLVKMLVRLLGEGVDLSFTPSSEVVYVSADPGAIEQVVVNLALNARDAVSGRGSIRLETYVAVVERVSADQPWALPGRFVSLRVSDDGCGMTPEIQEHIFEPFFTTKAPGKGTGLGLSVVYGIVRQHAGMVTVASQPGRGSCFEVKLPLSDGAPEKSRPETLEEVPGGRETILVVEDEPMVRDLALNLLSQAGYEVLVAADGEEALEVFEAHRQRIDLVLLDVVMPKLGGREVRDAVRKLAPSIRVLFTSGYDLGARGVFAPEPGEHVIPKPYRAPELLRRIREVLDAKAPELPR
ncbi:MAG: response regulator [Myxococcales bacterium]|nr:response regulator [Myxococcales bacterium]